MGLLIRTARDTDVDAIVRIAAEGGSPDAHAAHFGFVARTGRLVVSVLDDVVVGVAGSVPLPTATMVSDLFVAAAHRGGGIGGRLAAAVLDGAWHRCTFSSQEAAALRTYQRLGMAPQWQLLTMRGVGGGGASLPTAPWQHDRADLVAHLTQTGAMVGADHIVLPGDVTHVQRVVSPDADALLRVVAALPATPVEVSVPEHDPAVAGLRTAGFEVVDADVFCATDGVRVPAEVRCVHRGLC